MDPTKKLRVSLACAFAVVLVPPVAWIAHGVWYTTSTYDYGFSEMDWDGNGWVSISEVIDSMDVATFGARGKCREFISLKTGLPFRVVCPDGRSWPVESSPVPRQ